MKIAADLHIHSCLSPCGDQDMTPNNLVNMSAIKGLKAIAVTDHNTVRNLPAIKACCREVGLLLIPGLEVQTREDVHVLCYFPALENALAFGDLIENSLPPMPNKPEIFGEQSILNEQDVCTGTIEKLLLQSVPQDMEEIDLLCRAHGGICVPAHINRQANSLLYLLGFLPTVPAFPTVEINPKGPASTVELGKRHVLYNSDAHYLEDIFEEDHVIDLSECSAACFVEKYASLRE